MNRAYKIILSILIITCSVLCMPFSYKLKAESQLLAPPFLGVNINVIDVINNTRYVMRGSPEFENTNQMAWYCTARTSTGCDAWVTREPNGTTAKHNYEISFNGSYLNPTILNTNYIVELEFIFDNDYVGQFQLEYNEIDVGLVDQFVFVNGSSVSIKLDNFNLSNPSISVYGINLKNNQNKQWFFPVESFTPIMTMFDTGFEQVGFDNYNDYIYPIFKENSSLRISNTYSYNQNTRIKLILFTSRYIDTITNFNRFFTYNNNFHIENYIQINRHVSGYICSIDFVNDTNSAQTLDLKSINNNGKFTLIFNMPYGVNNDTFNVGTEFALQFKLKNSFLNNIEIIAQGNTQSQSSVNNANTTNQNAQSTFQQEEHLINNQEQAMQQNLDNLDIQNKNNNLFGNSKFIASAQWVKQQFDWFTNDNAFGYLITFSLVIGLALVIIGKLRG